MAVSNKLIKSYEVLKNKYFSLRIIPDVYKENANGIESYFETCTEFYNNRVSKYGYKKLHDGEDGVRRAVQMNDELLRVLEQYRRERLSFSMFFIEDTKNKDVVPVLTVFGSKSGLITSFVTYRNEENSLFIGPLIFFPSKRKEFDKLMKHIRIYWG